MKIAEVRKMQARAAKLLGKARIVITPEEKKNMEVADFGIGDIENIGLQVIIYENNDRYCAKEIILLPRQSCPEHRHPPVGGTIPGKQETFRCRWGEVYLYVPGKPAAKPKAKIPSQSGKYFTVWKEIVLRPGGQYTLAPGTLHWFQAGDEGAVVSEFSSTNTDDIDIWTDPRLKRIPVIED